MKKALLMLPILLLLAPAPAQIHFGVSEGDTFTFTLSHWEFEEDGTRETIATVEYEPNSDAAFTLKAGDTFTITIISLNPYENQTVYTETVYTSYATSTTTAALNQGTTAVSTSTATTVTYTTTGGYDYKPILVEYSSGSQTLQTYEYTGWGGFIIEPDWDRWRTELEHDATISDPDASSSTTIIDTADEFGYKSSYSYTSSDTGSSYSSTSETELRYKKSDGVITYIRSKGEYSYFDGTETQTENSYAELYRSGYAPEDTVGDLSLPGFQATFLITVIVLVIPIRRKYIH